VVVVCEHHHWVGIDVDMRWLSWILCKNNAREQSLVFEYSGKPLSVTWRPNTYDHFVLVVKCFFGQVIEFVCIFNFKFITTTNKVA